MSIIGFDYDGTIINIEPEKARAFGELLYKEWNIDSARAEKFWIDTGGTSRLYKFKYFFKRQFLKELPDSEYKLIEAKFSHILKTNFYPRVRLLPGAIKLLKFARQNFGYTFISSGVTHDEIKYLVKLNGIGNYFDDVFGTNNVYKSKADHFQKVLKNSNSVQNIFIADGEEDMRYAKKYDFIAIGVPTNHSKESLKESGADYVTDLIDCQSLIEKLI